MIESVIDDHDWKRWLIFDRHLCFWSRENSNETSVTRPEEGGLQNFFFFYSFRKRNFPKENWKSLWNIGISYGKLEEKIGVPLWNGAQRFKNHKRFNRQEKANRSTLRFGGMLLCYPPLHPLCSTGYLVRIHCQVAPDKQYPSSEIGLSSTDARKLALGIYVQRDQSPNPHQLGNTDLRSSPQTCGE